MLKIYVTYLFVHFSSKQLIFVYKHTLRMERLATAVFSIRALTYKSIYFFLLSTKLIGNRKELTEDLKQTMVNLALKGYCLQKMGCNMSIKHIKLYSILLISLNLLDP
jgi:hypothetical protein